MRQSLITRKTKETDVTVELNLDANSEYVINTDIKFFKHMLEQLAYHSGFGLKIEAKSLDGDSHHLIEDVGLALGSALKNALNEKKGINRYGQFILPMDEALVMSVVDISGRAFSKISADIASENVSDFPVVMLSHFFNSLAQNAQITIHIRELDGSDPHHIIEAVFKSFGRALSQAVAIGLSEEIPSTKGVL
ncbi:MAG: imidazoleglycerol-phosphate dehydratase HisB [Clostridium sp.]|nr:imidazoleglycerol-phosphate dehydratase HisB [Clostridium sp.]